MRINLSDTARASMVAFSLDNRCKCYLVDIIFSQANDAPVSDEDHIAANSFGIGIRRWQGIKARLLRSGLVERVNGFLLCTALEVGDVETGSESTQRKNSQSYDAIRMRRYRQRKKEESNLETCDDDDRKAALRSERNRRYYQKKTGKEPERGFND